MNSIVDKLRSLELSMSQEKGKFLLFALVLREDASDLWDLVVSSAWVTLNKSEALKYISNTLKNSLSPDEILKISRIVTIDPLNPDLLKWVRAINVEHGMANVENCNFFGLNIKHAYIITSQFIID